MCVYCVEDAGCEHERDACAASGGQPCASVRSHLGGPALAPTRVPRPGAALEPPQAAPGQEAGDGPEARAGYSRSAIIRSLISLVNSARVRGHGGSLASRY